MAGTRSILIVDDHPLFREGVKTLVDRVPGYRVAGEAGSAEQARKAAQELKPECILLDLSLPDVRGTELVKELSEALPHASVIVLSMHSGLDIVAESFQAGARGYIIKESAGERLAEALDTVARGSQYLDSAISPKVIHKLIEYSDRKKRTIKSSYDVLTRREQQILRMLAEGASAKTIAGELFISRKTVENHRANIKAKLDLRNPMDLVRYAVSKGLVDVDEPLPGRWSM